MPFDYSSYSSCDESSSENEDDEDCVQNYGNSMQQRKRPYEYRPNFSSYKSQRCSESQSPQKEQQTAGVYVLRSQNTDIYYVGKSNNVEKRILQHKHENGSNDVLVREKTLTVGAVHDLESWERNEVLTRMYQDGMDSVRGWRYTKRGPLSTEDRISARNDIMEKFDLCRRCGRNSHFANNCFARSSAFWCKDVPFV